MDFFSYNIHLWYSKFKRELPWRDTRDPYFIWLSEIILQQTRVDQGLAYYLKFTDQFPTVIHLANATEDQVLKLWQGLGYYSRARNLYFTAKIIKEQYYGKFPESYHRLLTLKGIGEYTAAAIASIAFHEPVAAVDGNVFRLLSRYFGIGDPIDTGAGKKTFTQLAAQLIQGTDPGMHNQAMMEFGALQCTPQKPNCLDCPLKDRCYAYSTNRIAEFPAKLKKTKQRDRYFNYFIFFKDENTWIKKRQNQDIWKNLYEFPLVETSEAVSLATLFSLQEVMQMVNSPFTIEKVEDWKIHLLSHQRIHYRILEIHLENENNMPVEFKKVNKADIFNFAVPKLLETHLKNHRNNEFNP